MSKIELDRWYSTETKKTVEKTYGSPFIFKVVQDIFKNDIVVLTDVDLSKRSEFLEKTWEISGDYCVFDVIELDEDGIILRPTEEMSFRGNATKNEMRIRVTYSDELLMVKESLSGSRYEKDPRRTSKNVRRGDHVAHDYEEEKERE